MTLHFSQAMGYHCKTTNTPVPVCSSFKRECAKRKACSGEKVLRNYCLQYRSHFASCDGVGLSLFAPAEQGAHGPVEELGARGAGGGAKKEQAGPALAQRGVVPLVSRDGRDHLLERRDYFLPQ